MSIDATALEKILGKTNRSYEESVQGMAFMKQLCTKHDLNKAAFISSGKRGAKKQGDASNGRRYSQEVALHFAQWADAALAVEIGEALALLISGQVKTEDSIRIATSVEAAIEKGRDMAPMEIDGGNLSLNETHETLGGMGSFDIFSDQFQAILEQNERLVLQVEALKAVILDLTEMPMGPSREAETDLPLWFHERDLRISEGMSRVSLAFGTPPILYLPRSVQDHKERMSTDYHIQEAETDHPPPLMDVSASDQWLAMAGLRMNDDEEDFDFDD